MRRRILVTARSQGRVSAAAWEAIEDVVLYFVPETEPDLSFRAQDDSEQCCLMLCKLRLISEPQQYSINKSKALLGFVGQQWEQHIVAELDSALNKWVDSVPDHRTCVVGLLFTALTLRATLVRWNPHIEDDVFFRQSALLYANYYHLQILVHRPFIPSPRKPSSLSFPSLAICTNAARSCSHLVDYSRERLGPVLPHLTVIQSRRNGVGPPADRFVPQMSIFTSGVVLLLNIWGGKRSGININPVKEM
jgi:hypothetical protein